jgi:hypothetical protein
MACVENFWKVQENLRGQFPGSPNPDIAGTKKGQLEKILVQIMGFS